MSDRNICFKNNCPVLEVTADGFPVGRCWYYCYDGKTCPRHGDVSKAFETYRETGKLTKVGKRSSAAFVGSDIHHS